MMFTEILFFELRSRMKKISTYIYFGVFFLIGFLIILLGGGALRRNLGAGVGNVYANAPFALYYLITMISHFGILITSAFFGSAAYRDFKENIHATYFSYPLKKIDFFAGRFAAAFIACLFIFSGTGIGALAASISPFVNPGKIGPINLFAYIQPYLIGVIPNVLFAGALFFSFALMTRKIFPVYVGSIGILMGYMVGVSLSRTFKGSVISALIDPFGQIAARNFYKYWTVAQKNSLLIPLEGDFLLNRIFWVAIGLAILIFAYGKFNFSYTLESKRQKSLPSDHFLKSTRQIAGTHISSFKAIPIFGFRNHIFQMMHTALQEFKSLAKNIYFLSILLFAVIFMFLLGFKNVGLMRGTQTYPVTYQVLDITGGLFYIFMLIMIIFCSGELVWRERDSKVQQIYDPLPVPAWIPFLGKLGALVMIQVCMMSLVMVSGLIIQMLHGYYHFQLGLYLKELFLIRLTFFVLISVFAMFIQVVVNKKYLGHFVTAILYLILIDEDILPGLGLEHNLYRYAGTPQYIYSEMNGFGPFAKPLLFFNLYWCAFAVLLLIGAVVFWMRGNDAGFRARLETVRNRLTGVNRMAAGASLAAFLCLGGFIFSNTNIINRFEPRKAVERLKVDYERTYQKYEDTPQPRIVDIKMDVDIFPENRSVRSKGRMILENKNDGDIHDVFIQVPRQGKLHRLDLSLPCSLTESSAALGVYIYTLEKPMRSGDKIVLHFEIELSEKGFKNHISFSGYENMMLLRNGTFLDYFFIVPSVSYAPLFSYELDNNERRKKYGLPPKARMPSLHDDRARKISMIGKDADWIDFEAVLSTGKDQTALTSGELVRAWEEDGRRYFHYRSRDKIQRYFPVISGKYRVRREAWKGIAIEIYYHEGHEYNLDLMMKAVKKSLDYYTENFSPYQFKELRIVEYPRYKLGAESYPNIIPVSEGYGFIAKFDPEESRVPYVFRVTAHEVGHQWWAHQVMGAWVEGEFLLSEVMAQYSALMVTKSEYDTPTIGRYMKERIDSYLKGRGRETKEEVPLVFSNLETYYVNYDKGMVVMNALQDYLGEDNLNAVLRKYIHDVAFQEPPYTTSLEFISYLKEAAPDHLQYIITDMFETITLYDNRAVESTCRELPNGRYLVKLKYEARKLRADGKGNEKGIRINDYVTFGAFGPGGEVLYLQKHRVDSPAGELEFVVDGMPGQAGIDPYYYLIDKNTDDNIIEIISD